MWIAYKGASLHILASTHASLRWELLSAKHLEPDTVQPHICSFTQEDGMRRRGIHGAALPPFSPVPSCHFQVAPSNAGLDRYHFTLLPLGIFQSQTQDAKSSKLLLKRGFAPSSSRRERAIPHILAWPLAGAPNSILASAIICRLGGLGYHVNCRTPSRDAARYSITLGLMAPSLLLELAPGSANR
jgi:hypothetical protein